MDNNGVVWPQMPPNSLLCTMAWQYPEVSFSGKTPGANAVSKDVCSEDLLFLSTTPTPAVAAGPEDGDAGALSLPMQPLAKQLIYLLFYCVVLYHWPGANTVAHFPLIKFYVQNTDYTLAPQGQYLLSINIFLIPLYWASIFNWL